MFSTPSSARSLFQVDLEAQRLQQAPLAHRMRPRTLDDFVGQDHVIGPGRLLRRAIEADQLSSLILYGPPGTGKTTLASIVAHVSASHFASLNAVLAGVPVLREEIRKAEERFEFHRQRTTLFVDEVHRWNKAQQDALLPHVETGAIIFIGATTANPFFEVIRPLVSRSRIFQLKPLQEQDIALLLQRALQDREQGLGHRNVNLTPEARHHLVSIANGDARSALNALELAVLTTAPDSQGIIQIDLAIAEESIQQRAVLYDKEGDVHFDAVSAFIKSLRGSDPDASLYWGTKMIHVGEDPAFLFRRLAILACEDVGLADPQAITVVDSCWNTYERIGMPEGMFPLAQAILYLATAPKSNSTLGIFEALQAVETEADHEVPTHLKDGSRDAREFGHGQGYLYPHAYGQHWVKQRYLPMGLEGRVFYEPGQLGHEGQIREDVRRRREEQLAAEEEWAPFGGEQVTYSPRNAHREDWLGRAGHASSVSLGRIRDAICTRARIRRHERVLVLHADNGLLLWEACRQSPEGSVWGLVSASRLQSLQKIAAGLDELDRPCLCTALDEIDSDIRFEKVVGLDPCSDYESTLSLLQTLRDHMAENTLCVLGQRLPKAGQRVHALVPMADIPAMATQLQRVEEELWTGNPNPRMTWDRESLNRVVTQAGWQGEIDLEIQEDQRFLERQRVQAWFASGSALGERLQAAGMSPGDLLQLAHRYDQAVGNQTVPWQQVTAFITLRP